MLGWAGPGRPAPRRPGPPPPAARGEGCCRRVVSMGCRGRRWRARERRPGAPGEAEANPGSGSSRPDTDRGGGGQRWAGARVPRPPALPGKVCRETATQGGCGRGRPLGPPPRGAADNRRGRPALTQDGAATFPAPLSRESRAGPGRAGGGRSGRFRRSPPRADAGPEGGEGKGREWGKATPRARLLRVGGRGGGLRGGPGPGGALKWRACLAGVGMAVPAGPLCARARSAEASASAGGLPAGRRSF